jgi:hypothetical protein
VTCARCPSGGRGFRGHRTAPAGTAWATCGVARPMAPGCRRVLVGPAGIVRSGQRATTRGSGAGLLRRRPHGGGRGQGTAPAWSTGSRAGQGVALARARSLLHEEERAQHGAVLGARRRRRPGWERSAARRPASAGGKRPRAATLRGRRLASPRPRRADRVPSRAAAATSCSRSVESRMPTPRARTRNPALARPLQPCAGRRERGMARPARGTPCRRRVTVVGQRHDRGMGVGAPRARVPFGVVAAARCSRPGFKIVASRCSPPGARPPRRPPGARCRPPARRTRAPSGPPAAAHRPVAPGR